MNMRSEVLTLERCTSLLKELIKIPSISKTEERLAKRLQQDCQKIGMKASIDRHGNMIAVKKFGKPGKKLVLNSHMDTVDVGNKWTMDPFNPIVKDGKMYGLGACDTKASIAAMLLAIEAVLKSEEVLAGELWFTAVVQEEVQGEKNKGTYKLIKDGLKADLALIGEPTNNNICRGCTGMVEVEIVTEGVPVHASVAEKGVNAIQQMIKIIFEINKIKPLNSKLLGKSSMNVGIINGGLRSSVVPDTCLCKIGRHVVENETGHGFLEQIESIIQRLSAKDPTIKAKATLTYDSAAGVVPENSELVTTLKEASSYVTGKEKSVVGLRAHLDSDFLINLAKIPSVALGPGDMNLAHTANEFVPMKEVLEASKIYTRAIMNTLKAR
jgi:acetylornithine deacetylase/succinyl-diaminopimelate desuccinylase family protein